MNGYLILLIIVGSKLLTSSKLKIHKFQVFDENENPNNYQYQFLQKHQNKFFIGERTRKKTSNFLSDYLMFSKKNWNTWLIYHNQALDFLQPRLLWTLKNHDTQREFDAISNSHLILIQTIFYNSLQTRKDCESCIF